MSVNNFFKRLFCQYIFKEKKRNLINRTTINNGDGNWYQIVDIINYASEVECLKCNHRKIKKYREIIELDRG